MTRLGRTTLRNLYRRATNRHRDESRAIATIAGAVAAEVVVPVVVAVSVEAIGDAIPITVEPAPEADAEWIRGVIREITAHSQDVMSGDHTAAGSGLFFDAHLHLRGATFYDDRQDYMQPFRVALLRVSDDWIDSEFHALRDDAADVFEMGSEYLARF